MKLSNKIKIDKPIDEVWQVLARDFEQADKWMAAVPKSYAKEGNSVNGAPVSGRICELSDRQDGPIADEKITSYDEENHQMSVLVLPQNSKKIPVKHNNLDISVTSLSPNQTEVVWNSNIELKTVGKVLFPVLKVGLNKNFSDILEELKFYVETGQPHPRKAKKSS